jgi:hypothetical protein
LLKPDCSCDDGIEEFDAECFVGSSLWVQEKQFVGDVTRIEALLLKIEFSELKCS